MSRLRPAVGAAAAVLAVASAAILATAGASATHASPLVAGDTTITPTLNPLIVPTSAVAPGSSIPTSAFSTSSAGIQLAVTLTCVTAIAGLIIATITLVALLRGGYGPFLRALLPRWLRGKSREPAPQPTLRYQPGPNDLHTGFEPYAEDPSPRRSRQTTRSGKQSGKRRDEWSDWDEPPPRSSRSSQSRRGFSRGSSSRARSRY